MILSDVLAGAKRQNILNANLTIRRVAEMHGLKAKFAPTTLKCTRYLT
jgi:glutamine synthetase